MPLQHDAGLLGRADELDATLFECTLHVHQRLRSCCRNSSLLLKALNSLKADARRFRQLSRGPTQKTTGSSNLLTCNQAETVDLYV